MTAPYCWLYTGISGVKAVLMAPITSISGVYADGTWLLSLRGAGLVSSTQPKLVPLDSLEVEEWLSDPTEAPTEAPTNGAWWVDSTEAPRGHYAQYSMGTCKGCAYYPINGGACDAPSGGMGCAPRERADGMSVIFKRKERL